MVKKKSERKPKNIMEAVGFQNIFNSEKTDFLLGLIILIIATYIIIAMVSFLNTGQADQSILEDLRPGEWLNTNRTSRNLANETDVHIITIARHMNHFQRLIVQIFIIFSPTIIRNTGMINAGRPKFTVINV